MAAISGRKPKIVISRLRVIGQEAEAHLGLDRPMTAGDDLARRTVAG
jgi:hypothetical protein